MASHIGIELSAGVCRIVDVETRRSGGSVHAKRVKRFAVLPRDGAEMALALEGLRGRPASVVVWGVPADHRQVMVTAGSYESMRREARRALSVAGVETRGALLDISRAPSTTLGPGPKPRRPVVVALASSSAVSDALRPLRAANIDIKTVATPATALVSLARARRMFAPPADSGTADGSTGIVDAYAAIEESATCIALFREGTLVAARELSWGFRVGRHLDLRDRSDVALRFADELAEFLTSVGGSPQSVRQLTLCGGSPELRSVAALLTSRFDIEVEPLDVPFGIDGEVHPFVRERCADMWMAWAVAIDQPAPLSLLHAQQIRAAQARFARAAIAAGIVVGVAIGWQAAQCPLLRAEPLTAPRRAAPQPPTTPRSVDVRTVRLEETGAKEDR